MKLKMKYNSKSAQKDSLNKYARETRFETALIRITQNHDMKKSGGRELVGRS